MVRYVVLATFTEIGASQIQDTTRRAENVVNLAASMGVTVESMFWTLGEFDAVVTLSAVDEGTLIAFTAVLARQGYVRTRMMRAYTAAEFGAMLSKMPGAPVELEV